jgi:predicted regulator of Ras-like GTPase activity (Roadblock/LC7/MglB family)
MPFQRIVDELVESTPGATGTILLDSEGEAIVFSGSTEEYDLKLLAAHKGIILGLLREVNGRLLGAGSCDTVITTGARRVIAGTVANDYNLVMVLQRNALTGRALCRFRTAREQLAKEIC